MSLNIALAGVPNSGKTSLFNALTGARQRTANYPGVTVEKKEGSFTTPEGNRIHILDLPGSYSLKPQSLDEKVSLDVLLNQRADVSELDAVVAVIDATQLKKGLTYVLELRSLGYPVVVVLNMMDLVQKRNLSIDINQLSRELMLPVIPTVAIQKTGVSQIHTVVDELSQEGGLKKKSIQWKAPTLQDVKARSTEALRMIQKCVEGQYQEKRTLSEKIDRLLLSQFWGHLILAAAMFFIFQAVFTWSGPFMDAIETGVGALAEGVGSILPEAWHSFVLDGVIAGVGSVVVFVPQIAILFFFILLLDSTGYSARAAVLLDKTMTRLGLPGRAFLPLLSSFACAIPGVMATRTMKHSQDRLVTMLVAPLMTCAARLPVYALLIAAFVPSTMILGGWVQLQGLVMFGLYVAALVFGFVVAFLLRIFLIEKPPSQLMMEIPSYKVPQLKALFLGVFDRVRLFLWKAGKYIFITSVGLWFLSTYPEKPMGYEGSQIEYSYAGRIGKTIEPVFEPIGFDWRIATGLIPGFAAREVMVGALATIYAIEEEDGFEESLATVLQSQWSLATALALLVWFIFSPQCFATFAVIKRETQSWRWTIFSFTYLLFLAYLFSFVTFQVVSRLLV